MAVRPISPGVGRTNLILLAIGLGGAVALMLLMQTAMEARDDRRPDLPREIRAVLGTRLTARPRVETSGAGTGTRITVRIEVVAGADPRRLATDAGHAVWRRRREVETPAEVVVEVRVVDREPVRLLVPPPWRVRERIRELPAGPPGRPG